MSPTIASCDVNAIVFSSVGPLAGKGGPHGPEGGAALARDSDPVHGGRPAERVRRQILGDPTEEIGGWGIVIDSDGIPRVSTAR
ncbi:hypothetical protein GCM10010177_81340 [Actinomadura citrea]|nr:hypothetical protein GCM10010177_81340 [Actinomadura citrea]